MDKKIIAGIIVGVLVVGGASFYGGMLYEQSKSPRGGGNFTGGQFQQGQFAGGGRGTRGAGGGGFTTGTILSKDATSITVKMQDGSTKIVLVGSSTSVQKSASGTLDDLAVGTNVLVMGTANSDQSLTAQSVQIRPQMPTAPATPAQ